MQFKVYDKQEERYLDDDVYLGKDGYLYEMQEDPYGRGEMVLKVPENIWDEYQWYKGTLYHLTPEAFARYCKEHQQEWYWVVEQYKVDI